MITFAGFIFGRIYIKAFHYSANKWYNLDHLGQGDRNDAVPNSELLDQYYEEDTDVSRFVSHDFKIIIWKAQGVPQLKNAAHPKHQEEEEISHIRNHTITCKR